MLIRQTDNRDMQEIERSDQARIDALMREIERLRREIQGRDLLIEGLRWDVFANQLSTISVAHV